MLSFKEYTSFFDTLFESEPVKFAGFMTKGARGHIDRNTLDSEIDGKKINFAATSMIDPDKREHHITFSTDGSMSKRDAESSETGRKVLTHVGKTLMSFHNQKVANKPGRHTYRVTSTDDDPSNQARKSKVYGKFMRRFAKKVGGQYDYDSDEAEHVVHVTV